MNSNTIQTCILWVTMIWFNPKLNNRVPIICYLKDKQIYTIYKIIRNKINVSLPRQKNIASWVHQLQTDIFLIIYPPSLFHVLIPKNKMNINIWICSAFLDRVSLRQGRIGQPLICIILKRINHTIVSRMI